MFAAETLAGPSIPWFTLSPLLALLAGACVLMLGGSLLPQWPRGLYGIVSAATAATSIVLCFFLWDNLTDGKPETIIADALAFDHFAVLGTITICVAVLLASLTTSDYLVREGEDGPELFVLYLTAAIGGIVMVAAQDLIVLFLGLETLSLALYVLAASNRRREESQEAGLKYFILGGFSSAFFLYGIALIYGATKHTNLGRIMETLSTEQAFPRNDVLLLAGVGLLLVGLAFKVAAVPFQVWTPDVYQGAPTPVTSFMASAGKTAAFAALLRVSVTALESRVDDWRPVVWVLAVLSLVVGSVLAVTQTNVKRMLAYSSISHAGFILLGVEAASHTTSPSASDGIASAMTYLLLYTVLVIGTFTIVGLVSGKGDVASNLGDLRGLGRRRPALALALTVFLLAQAGMPLTSGFVAKFGVIQASVETRSYAIAIIAMLSSVIGAYLYLRIMVSAWMEDAEGEGAAPRVPFLSGLAVTAAVVFTLVVGVVPGWLLDATRQVINLAGR
ncbi:MAG: NADH-quinone oxidoreductase subunit N [Ilumatobacteraceae bacterium]|nr:NADH-quinone oxidoreductase subunit N [Ilumatobacteraceae bacterium]